jgi:dTDP-4-dehydrorhamnose 3,5-epimerase
MIVQPLEIQDVKLITPSRFNDERGFFSETYSRRGLADVGIDVEFVQDNHSLSSVEGVVRGLHLQAPPHAEGKLVRVARGSIFDVALDIRRNSPTFGRHVSTVLSAENWTQIWIPEGFAHGFCTLEPDTEVIYKTTVYYAPQFGHGVRWNDPALGIRWPIDAGRVLLSDADRNNPLFAELTAAFEAWHEPIQGESLPGWCR